MLGNLFATSTLLQGSVAVLLDAALKGAILVIVAAGIAYLLRGRSAASRHAVWTAAVVGHLAIPVLAILLPSFSMPVFPAATWLGTSSTASAAVAALPGATRQVAHTLAPAIPSEIGKSPASDGARDPANPLASAVATQTPSSGLSSGKSIQTTGISAVRLLALIWFAGALLVLLRLAAGTWRVGQLAREGARVDDGSWLSLTQRLANTLGVTRPLTLLRGERLAVPVTWGIVYPAVLLPEDADKWPEERRRFVLVHEMAHVKRFDALTQLLAQLSLAIFWFDPLVWVAAQRMRVEREHACDDYVIRDGTTPSLYAGELLEMVRSIGTRRHDHAAPAFAALAMARRSEFEGRMLAILDPKQDRHSLNGRGAMTTALIVGLLAFPLAAWRPFQQPTRQPAKTNDEFPPSFKVSFSPGAVVSLSAKSPTSSAGEAAIGAAQGSTASWSCDGADSQHHGTHINATDDGPGQIVQYLATDPGRCAEASIVGPIRFSPDETHITQLSPGGFARFRERTAATDRAVSVTPAADGSLSYAASIDRRTVPFDATMQAWLSSFLPEVLREAGINVPERVARVRAQGGVPAVLDMIGHIRSVGSRRSHYEALLDGAPLSDADAEKVAIQVPRDLAASSGELSSVIQKLPRSVMRSAGARQALANALPQIRSSGDRASTLEVLAPNADPALLVVLAKAAEGLPSSGDKANFLISTAAEYLSSGNQSLTNAYFSAAVTIPSSGDLSNVLISAMPYGHGNANVTTQVIESSKRLQSSGDAANVLISLVSQRVILPDNTRATRALIARTLTMESSGDRANVLIEAANKHLLSTQEVRDEYVKAAAALPSVGDRENVLAAAAQGR